MISNVRNPRMYMNSFLLITGAGMHNIGAQAMMFITIDEIRKRYPEIDIYVEANRPKDCDVYDFSFVSPSPRKTLLLCLPTVLQNIIKRKKGSSFKKYHEFLKSCIGIIDISGFAYGTPWGIKGSRNYLLRIASARRLNIPIFLMPQSFGPFDFKGIDALSVKLLAKKLFPYCKVIMARESEGKAGLEKAYGLKNVIKTEDMVLQNSGIDLANIYKSIPEPVRFEVKANSVALIPNAKNIIYGDANHVIDTYLAAINRLLEKGKNVYIISHATMDEDLCRQLKGLYEKDDRVILIQDYLSCVEFDAFVKQFDYIVASRFHAIVHAYKNGIPAVILGWAAKYSELSLSLGQDKYQVNVSKSDFKEDFLGMIDEMDINQKQEKAVIKDHLEQIKKGNVFDYIQL